MQAAALEDLEQLGRLELTANVGSGKAQPVEEPVLTPEGWRCMGDLKPGDFVVGYDGLPTPVLAVHPQGVRPVYRLTWSDGRISFSDVDHLWPLRTQNGAPFRPSTVREILASPLVWQSTGNRKYRALINKPVHYPVQDLSVDPYTLGVLLGDGSLSQDTAYVTSMDPDIVANLQTDGVPIQKTASISGGLASTYRIARVRGTYRPNTANPFTEKLRGLGVMGCLSIQKKIPQTYLKGSVAQRLSLLRGIMDTDGSFSGGNCEISLSSEAFIQDVCELIRSLGGTAKYVRKETTHNPSFRCSVRMPAGVNPFWCARKSVPFAEHMLRRQRQMPARTLLSVEPDGERECVCITVGSTDGLYLTRDYVVTHNSLLGYTAPTVLGLERAVWLTLPSLIDKTKRELERYGLDWRVFEHFDYVSADTLSRDLEDEILFSLKPQMVVCDESHILKNFRSARSQRVSKYLLANPSTIFLPMTGTPGDESLANVAHIKYWVHGPALTPLPCTKELDNWCQALDVKVELRRPPGVLGNDLKSARENVGGWLEQAPGSIYYRRGEVACSLYLDCLKYDNPSHDRKFHAAREQYTTPDGRQFSEPIELHQVLQRLALGYWELLDPEPPEEWNYLRLKYGAFIRKTIEKNPERYVQPLQVINDLRHGKLLSGGLHEAWTEIKPTFKPNKKIEWFDEGPCQTVAAWLEKERGVVWTPFPAVGKKLTEMTGLPFFHNKGIDKKIGQSVEEHNGRTGIILSTASNSFGRNLQDRWHQMLILGTGAKSDLLSQQIGRLHRRGQTAEFVRATFFVGVRENLEALYKARSRAWFDHDLNRDGAGKLLQGDWLLPGVAELGEGSRWSK